MEKIKDWIELVCSSFVRGLRRGFKRGVAARRRFEAERHRKQQKFLDLVLETAETGDKSKLAAWWREHFPGYKWWCFGPSFQIVLPDDGSDECV